MLVKLGLKSSPTVDPFSDLDPILDDSISDGKNLVALCEDEFAAGYSRLENENDINSDDK